MEQETYPSELAEGSNSYQNAQPHLDISHSHSINTINTIHSLPADYIISEDLLNGQRINGRMSNVRRFFCLFVTFDFLLIGLMWIICVMLDGEYLIKALTEQIVHYNIKSSLFDIVLIAFLRFFFLVLFYGLIYINHWIVIALSTTFSCAFLIAKVFLFDWPHSSQQIFEVLLVLVSFILSWGEAWFLDFRVLPQELHANRFLIGNTHSERAPLIHNFLRTAPSMYTESVNFYSPQASPEPSLNSFRTTPHKYSTTRLSHDLENELKITARKTLQQAWDLYLSPNWKFEKKEDINQVFSMHASSGVKIFKLETEFNCSPKFLLDELYYKIEDLPSWNSAVKEAHKVQAIDEHTDVVHLISQDAMGGMVSARDFVSLRYWEFIENRYVIATVKTKHPAVPEIKKYTRGENGVGCYVMEMSEQPDKCKFTWILDTDIKFKMMKMVLYSEMIKMLFTFSKFLKDHIEASKI